jgi:intein/homing endonuclease
LAKQAIAIRKKGNMEENTVNARRLSPGMGEAVARRTILRTKADGELETWADVAQRVALGNTALHPTGFMDLDPLHDFIGRGIMLMSGRHLQHGDSQQPNKSQELFTNCSTSSTSFLLYYLLLNGSGVGRDYSDASCVVDWRFMPEIEVVLKKSHPDYMAKFRSLDELNYDKDRDTVHVIEDSREGWAKGIEILETLAFEKIHKDKRIIFDFSNVRSSGSPISGMQGRPAAGPVDTMETYLKVASMRTTDFDPWKQALHIDHYLAENVLVGGARRSARMATKWYKDSDIREFIHIKEGGDLWTANMSVLVDRKYWKAASMDNLSEESRLATEISMAQYYNKNGEPGYINVDRLDHNNSGKRELWKNFDLGSDKYKVSDGARELYKHLINSTKKLPYFMIVNPCSEIPLSSIWGGFCVIGDLAPYHADTLDEIKAAGRQMVRALMRVNLMDSIYSQEVERTNRIGVSLTGIHEFAWKFFNIGFHDMVQAPMSEEVEAFWNFLKELSEECREEAKSYAKVLGVKVPHTLETIKPAGCRTLSSYTTTDKGIYTLNELLALHPSEEDWAKHGSNTVGGNVISKTFRNGSSKIARITLKNGRELFSTFNHSWKVKSEWVETFKLVAGTDILETNLSAYTRLEDKLLLTCDAPTTPNCTLNGVVFPKTLNTNLAYLIGTLYGNGSFSDTKYRIRFTHGTKEIISYYCSLWKKEFNIDVPITKDARGGRYYADFANKWIYTWFIKNGLHKDAKSKNLKGIPKSIRETSKKAIIAFIAGYADTDGCFYAKSFCIDSASKDMMQNLQIVAEAVGFSFGLSHNTSGTNFQDKKSMYKCHMSRAFSSEESINLLNGFSIKAKNKPAKKALHIRSTSPYKVIAVDAVDAPIHTADIEVENTHSYCDGGILSHNTTSKLFDLTEGAHLLSMKQYLRWVQFPLNSPLVEDYKAKGYPTRVLKVYENTVIVGFPTKPLICRLGMEDKLVTTGEATMEEQYKYLQLIEEYWLRSKDRKSDVQGNQISYTLKYNPKRTRFAKYHKTVLKNQGTIKCCAVMPQISSTVYEYQPEEPISSEEYDKLVANINDPNMNEDIDMEHLQCASGACPI